MKSKAYGGWLGPLRLNVMQMPRTAGFTAGAAGICGLLAFVLASPQKAPLEIKVVGKEPAGMFDDAGSEMFLVKIAISIPPHTRSALYFGKNRPVVEFKVGDRWSEVQDTFSLSSLGADETKKEVLLMASGADRCRIGLKYAYASIWWNLGGFVSRCGIKLSPSYWRWAGWPNAEGTHPRWKSTTIEIPLAPNSFPVGRVHNHSWQPTSGLRLAAFPTPLARSGCTHRYAVKP
jgi:hypothetical protein